MSSVVGRWRDCSVGLGLIDRRLGRPHVVRVRVDQAGQVRRRLVHDLLGVSHVPLGRVPRRIRARLGRVEGRLLLFERA